MFAALWKWCRLLPSAVPPRQLHLPFPCGPTLSPSWLHSEHWQTLTMMMCWWCASILLLCWQAVCPLAPSTHPSSPYGHQWPTYSSTPNSDWSKWVGCRNGSSIANDWLSAPLIYHANMRSRLIWRAFKGMTQVDDSRPVPVGWVLLPVPQVPSVSSHPLLWLSTRTSSACTIDFVSLVHVQHSCVISASD